MTHLTFFFHRTQKEHGADDIQGSQTRTFGTILDLTRKTLTFTAQNTTDTDINSQTQDTTVLLQYC